MNVQARNKTHSGLTEEQIADRLIAAHSAYAAKTGKQPYMKISLTIYAGGKKVASFYGEGIDDNIHAIGADAAEALDRLDAMIAAIPSEAERLRNDAAKAVAAAIEKCRAAGYDPDFVNPLIEMSKRISENAITFTPASEARAMIGGAA